MTTRPALTPRPPLPGLRAHLVVVLFLLAVSVVLGSVPGWDLCTLAWRLLIALPTLAVLAFTGACQSLAALFHRRWPHAIRRAGQLALPLAGIVAQPVLGHISQYVELSTVQSQLRAAAWKRPQEGGAHVALITMDSFLLAAWGYAYDDSGEIGKPCGKQSDAWQKLADGAGINNLCAMNVTHLVGPYYEWFYQ